MDGSKRHFFHFDLERGLKFLLLLIMIDSLTTSLIYILFSASYNSRDVLCCVSPH